ncbi:hypothetical protein E4U23_008713 [Claviceps purpurea]|nr:hypothetical protein E4U23_008713 [Claviceps purpurea]
MSGTRDRLGLKVRPWFGPSLKILAEASTENSALDFVDQILVQVKKYSVLYILFLGLIRVDGGKFVDAVPIARSVLEIVRNFYVHQYVVPVNAVPIARAVLGIVRNVYVHQYVVPVIAVPVARAVLAIFRTVLAYGVLFLFVLG